MADLFKQTNENKLIKLGQLHSLYWQYFSIPISYCTNKKYLLYSSLVSAIGSSLVKGYRVDTGGGSTVGAAVGGPGKFPGIEVPPGFRVGGVGAAVGTNGIVSPLTLMAKVKSTKLKEITAATIKIRQLVLEKKHIWNYSYTSWLKTLIQILD